jgi:predicted signal transduction protein with EAL and GGDEF domain
MAVLKASLYTDEPAARDFAGTRKIELIWKIALAKLTSLSYEFMSLDPSNLTNTVLVLVCHACAAALARWRSDRPARRPGIAAFG